MLTHNPKQLPLNKSDEQLLEHIIGFGKSLFKRMRYTFIITFLLSLITFSRNDLLTGFAVAIFITLVAYYMVFGQYLMISQDLKSNLKIRYLLTKYEIQHKKNIIYLISDEPKIKLELEEELLSHINFKESIIIEMTKRSKTLLFISHNSKNLLDLD